MSTTDQTPKETEEQFSQQDGSEQSTQSTNDPKQDQEATLSKFTRTPMAELLKKHGVTSTNKTKESLGAFTLIFSGMPPKVEDDSAATIRNLNRRKGK